MPSPCRHPIGLTLQPLGLADPETPQSIMDGFRRLRGEAGLSAVEIWMAPEHRPRPCVYWPEDYTPARRAEMGRFLTEFDYWGVHLPFLFNNYIAPNPVIREPARRQMRLGVRIAADMGARYCVAHAEFDNRGFVSQEDNLRLYAEVYAELADLAAPAGTLICVETCFFAQKPEVILALCQAVARPNFGIALDAGKAMLNNGGNAGLHRLIDIVATNIRHTHLYDYPGGEDRHRVLPGGGVVDIPGVVRRLLCGGYRGCFHLETSGDYQRQKTAILDLRSCVESAGT